MFIPSALAKLFLSIKSFVPSSEEKRRLASNDL